MSRKKVWALVSLEIVEDEELGDEAVMDIVNEELVQYGFTVDDMGIFDPSDMDKFYPEEGK